MEETVIKKRGRPPKQTNEQESTVNLTNQVSADDNAVLVHNIDNNIQDDNKPENTKSSTIECDSSEPDMFDSYESYIHHKQGFVDDKGITWTPHKYNIGDIVWVPVEQLVNKNNTFMCIETELRKMPKKFTVSSVVYTNKVSYTFKETSKVIAAEMYVCQTEEQCLLLCKEMSN